MKLLLAARRYPPDVRSGTETVFANLYAQARVKHDVRLVVGYRTSADGFPPEAVAVDLRGKGPAAYVAMEAAVVREARRFRPDVVLSNSIEIRVPGVPNVVIVHDLNFGEAQGRRSVGGRVREALYAAQGRTLPAVITVSAASAARLVEIGVPAARIATIGNGVDIAKFVPRPAPPGPVHFVYPSRILPGKGQHVAIDALGRMRPDQRARCRLTIVGAAADGIYLDKLKVQAWKLPVTFATDVDDIVPYYQDADVIVFPTLMEEGFGFTAVEGMACGKPVIWSDQPAIREATGGIGVAVPGDDADALRNAMSRLADAPAERERLGAEGRVFVEARSWARVWERYEAVLEGVRA
jgi:glycosyltransferase involved in cell wall biosynthesis